MVPLLTAKLDHGQNELQQGSQLTAPSYKRQLEISEIHGNMLNVRSRLTLISASTPGQ